MNQADTAWMLCSTALVLLMTPMLAFFYGGLVRSKNALNTMMMSFIALGFVGVAWALLGYSLAFSNWTASPAFIPFGMPAGGFLNAIVIGATARHRSHDNAVVEFNVSDPQRVKQCRHKFLLKRTNPFEVYRD